MLLRKRRQASSLLVWTGVAATAGGVLWMVLAPLQETIAVQGKLQPLGQVREIRALGIRSVLLFGIPRHKDDEGTGAWDPDGPVPQAIAAPVSNESSSRNSTIVLAGHFM